jgi:hypothetical protein
MRDAPTDTPTPSDPEPFRATGAPEEPAFTVASARKVLRMFLGPLVSIALVPGPPSQLQARMAGGRVLATVPDDAMGPTNLIVLCKAEIERTKKWKRIYPDFTGDRNKVT